VFVVKLVAMVLAPRMLGFVAAVIALPAVTAVACQRRTDHRQYQCCSKDETAQSAPPMRADD
jgi:hypothetical protein